MKIVDQLLLWQNFQQDNKPLFDIIFIDTAPIYRSVEGSKNIYEECKVWLPKFSDAKSYQKLAPELLKEWLFNTISQQEAKIGPFLHPSFTGLVSLEYWSGINLSILNSHEDYYNQQEKNMQTKYDEYLERNSLSNKDEYLQYVSIDVKNGFSHTSLGKLYVPQPKDYYDSLKSLERVPVLEKSARKDEIIEHGGLLEILKNSSISSDIKFEALTLLQEDLSYCHRAMHKRINRKFQAVFEEKSNEKNGNNYKESFKHSILIGLPLSFYRKSSLQDNNNSLDEFPDTYRGGLWVYATTSDDWTYAHESYLLDMAKFAWLHYMDQYTLDAVIARQNIEAAQFTHQVAGLIVGIESDSGLSLESKQKLWHLKMLTDIWGNIPIDVEKDITRHGETEYSEWIHLRRLTNHNFLDTLIDFAIGQTISRSQQTDKDDNAGMELKELLDKINSQDLLQRLGYQLPEEMIIPDWIRYKGFVLCFHHCFWQAAYHSAKAMIISKEKVSHYLAINSIPENNIVEIISIDENYLESLSPEREQRPIIKDNIFFRRIEQRLKGKFKIDIKQKGSKFTTQIKYCP